MQHWQPILLWLELLVFFVERKYETGALLMPHILTQESLSCVTAQPCTTCVRLCCTSQAAGDLFCLSTPARVFGNDQHLEEYGEAIDGLEHRSRCSPLND